MTLINLYPIVPIQISILLKSMNHKENHILVYNNKNHTINSTLSALSPSKEPKIIKIPHNICPIMIISKTNNKIHPSNNQFNTKIKDQELWAINLHKINTNSPNLLHYKTLLIKHKLMTTPKKKALNSLKLPSCKRNYKLPTWKLFNFSKKNYKKEPN